MPISEAFQNFKESLSAAEELLKIEKTNYKNPPRQGEQKAVQGLRGAVSVLVVASFEQFLKDSIEEHLSKLTTHPPVHISKLPDGMRLCSTYNTLDYAMRGPHYGTRLSKKDRLPHVDSACKKVVSETISPAAFVVTGGNPSADTVKQLMKDLDIGDIFDRIQPKFQRKWGRPEAHTFLRDKLNEIVNRRHVVAHTANALNTTRTQLRESIKFLKILADLIDSQVKEKVSEIKRAAKRP